MKISRRFTAVLGAAAALAMPVAAQAQVTYYTTGVFTSSTTNAVTANGITITFPGLGSTFISPTPSPISFGDFVTTGTSTTGGVFSDNFTLTVTQTSPTGGTGVFAGSVNGKIYSNGGGVYWVPSNPLSINIGASTYTLFTQSPNTPYGPGWTIVNPNVNNGHTSLQGSLTTPEPSSMALLGTGLIGLVPMIRRKKQS